MKLYRYCASQEHMLTWINGGQLPLKLASYHRRNERQGTQTPDEVVQRRLRGTDTEGFERFFRMDPNGGGPIRVTGLTIDQRPQPDIAWDQDQRDGLILCFCTEADKEIARRLGKEYCVEILDEFSLRKALDVELKLESDHRLCQYTTGYDRSTFLKHKADAWQKEYRLFWKLTSERIVNIPAGTGTEVRL